MDSLHSLLSTLIEVVWLSSVNSLLFVKWRLREQTEHDANATPHTTYTNTTEDVPIVGSSSSKNCECKNRKSNAVFPQCSLPTIHCKSHCERAKVSDSTDRGCCRSCGSGDRCVCNKAHNANVHLTRKGKQRTTMTSKDKGAHLGQAFLCSEYHDTSTRSNTYQIKRIRGSKFSWHV